MATTNKKSTNKKRSNSTSKNTSKNNNRNKRSMSDEDLLILNYVVIIGALFLCVLLFLCNFGVVGSLGEIISNLMFGLFGTMAYIFPVFLIVLAFLWISKQSDSRYSAKFVAFIVLFLIIGVFFEVSDGFSSTSPEQYSITELFNTGADTRSGGGVFAGSIGYCLNKYISTVATYLVVIVMMFICFIIIFGKSFIDMFVNGGAKIKDTAKEANEYRREHMTKNIRSNQRDVDEQRPQRNFLSNIELVPSEKEKNTEEKNEKQNSKSEIKKKKIEEEETNTILRMDKKVSGISQNTVLKEPANKKQDDMHEIVFKEDLKPEKETIKVRDKNLIDSSIRFHTADYDDGYDNISTVDNTSSHTPLSDSSNFEKFENVENEIFEAKITNSEENISHTTTIASDEKEEIVRIEKPSARLTSNKSNVNKIENDSKANKPKSDYSNEKYKFPPLSLLAQNTSKSAGDSRNTLGETAQKLEAALDSFGVKAKVTDISQGPSVTRYELEPAVGVKVSRITSLQDDLKLHLAAKDIRIEAPIPGKSAVGIEVPNTESSGVMLRELFEDNEFKNFKGNILFAVGKDISGKVIVTDISKMPHMLIAGSTGSGKSVCINTLIMSIIFKHDPKDVQLIMVDPKVVELNIYNGIPHLMIPVVTDPKKAAGALNWAVAEMTDRYKKFADMNVRDLKGYNQKVAELSEPSEEHKHLPQIVIIVDELADLMMVAAKEVEESICRLAQLARACGIHLILATQRPSVDVITGLIKANMPSRVAFAVSSSVDSRTILDMNGAEKLLGKGDMLFYPQGYTKPARIQGAFVSDSEVSDVVDFIKNQKLHNEFGEKAMESVEKVSVSQGGNASSGDNGSEYDDYFIQAGYFIIEANKASIGNLQRKFKIGFNRAARIMDQLCEAGVVGSDQGTKPREILMSQEQFDQYVEEYV